MCRWLGRWNFDGSEPTLGVFSSYRLDFLIHFHGSLTITKAVEPLLKSLVAHVEGHVSPCFHFGMPVVEAILFHLAKDAYFELQ